MSYLSRTQLGKHLGLRCVTLNSSRAAAAPTDCPTITIFDSSFTTVLAAKKIPAVDPGRYTGVFHYWLFVGNNPHVPLEQPFAAGRYFVRYDWTISGTTYSKVDTFDVIAGGHQNGAVIAMEAFDRPHSRFMVMQLDNGHLVAGRNPKA